MSARNHIAGSAILVGEVELGTGNVISHNAILIGPLKIGNNNFIGQNVTLGSLPQDDIFNVEDHLNSTYASNPNLKSLQIGDENIFREYSSAHKGAFRDTSVGNNNFVMSYTNISHDSIIGNNVKLASNVSLGGFVQIQDNSYIGMSASLLQFVVVGSGVMVGAHSTVTRDVKPGVLSYGSPSRTRRVNSIGLSRLGLSQELDFPSYLRSEVTPEPLIAYMEIFQKAIAQNSRDRILYREIREILLKGKK